MDNEYNDLVELIDHHLASINESFSSESKLRNNLKEYLNKLNIGWQWVTEKSFRTNRLTNEKEIFFDLFGIKDNKAFIIELKHVKCNKQGIPHDRPAFSYDVLKDCVKIELAIGKSLIESNEFEKIYGISIGLTNYSGYWDENYQTTGWAKNYILKIKPNTVNDIRGIINTHIGGNNEFSTIYKNRRCHISFGLIWNGKWRNTRMKDYRCLILTTRDTNPEYLHNPDSSNTIPFIKPKGKETFLKIRYGG